MPKKFVPRGIMPALITPFAKDGEIIEQSFREIIDYTISKGAAGVVPAGTTGEFVYMNMDERKKLLSLTTECVNGRVPIIAGTGQSSTEAATELTKYAADIGCDAALIVSPFYLKPTDKGYYEHYATIARKSDLPVIMYNIPQMGGMGVLPVSVVEDLAELDNIVGIKDSSGNITYMLELLQKLKGRISVINGNDEIFFSAVTAGVNAAIMASANLMPHLWNDLLKKVRKGDIDGALKLQLSMQTLTRIVTRYGGAPPVRAALKMMGIDSGKARMPLNTGGTLTPELKEEIRVELEKLGLIGGSKHVGPAKEVDINGVLLEAGLSAEQQQALKVGRGSSQACTASVVCGSKTGPLGSAFVRLLTTPRIGREALSVILEPNLAVRPSSLMLPGRKISSMRQASVFYGPVQSGAARAVAGHLAAGKISPDAVQNNVMVMVIDVDLDTVDRRAVTAATEVAVSAALSQIWR
ncbi:MAG: 4-hydroxy-tetrahydrodipicolinate synthase [Candidatus Thorarchaeota archaeon]|nr:MAG: 4-hydroxy-tetrahydrodipicolinate synthase [Candidatus Thorarchaeota archaeon]